MAKEEYLLKLMSLEQEANRFEQQMQLIDQQVDELQSLHSSLEALEKTKEKELFANIGKNIFIKTELKCRDLLVDVGNKTFIKKSIEETLEVIKNEANKLSEGKTAALENIQTIQMEMEKIVAEAEKAKEE